MAMVAQDIVTCMLSLNKDQTNDKQQELTPCTKQILKFTLIGCMCTALHCWQESRSTIFFVVLACKVQADQQVSKGHYLIALVSS